MTHLLRKPVVQKYGGSSLSTSAKVRIVAEKVLARSQQGDPVVVVVSANGDTTTELLARARQLCSTPPRRELDMLLSSGERMSTALLAMAIEEAGGDAISLTGPQSGILTDDRHSCAGIISVRPDRVVEELAAGRVVIVAGFQGLSPSGEVTTLGRGGSDTTAVALAGALSASCCEIYSDVDGVYTADPNIVQDPLHLESIDTGLMAEFALQGARVLHPHCIQLAHREEVPIHALSTFDDSKYTRIRSRSDTAYTQKGAELQAVVGVASRKQRLEIRSNGCADELLARIEEHIGSEEAALQRQDGDAISLLVDLDGLPDPNGTISLLNQDLHGLAEVRVGLASVSVVTRSAADGAVVAAANAVLRDCGMGSSALYRRPHSLSFALPAKDREGAVRALHGRFVEEALAIGA